MKLRYPEWTVIIAAAWLFTAFLGIPLCLKLAGLPLYHRDPGASVSRWREQEYGWCIMFPAIWAVGMLAIRLSRQLEES